MYAVWYCMELMVCSELNAEGEGNRIPGTTVNKGFSGQLPLLVVRCND